MMAFLLNVFVFLEFEKVKFFKRFFKWQSITFLGNR